MAFDLKTLKWSGEIFGAAGIDSSLFSEPVPSGTAAGTVSKEAADVINSRRAAGGRTVCVGTTSCRTLESAAGADGLVRPAEGETGIFIYPGYRFRATDALITNFHLPKSTLLMLVSAFYSREKMLEAYRTAGRPNSPTPPPSRPAPRGSSSQPCRPSPSARTRCLRRCA